MDKQHTAGAKRWLFTFTASAAGRLAADLIKAIFTEDT